MEPGTVIEGFDVVEDCRAGFGVGGEAATVDELVFETAPERLNVGVVVAIALSAHRGKQLVFGQDCPVGSAGELGAAVGVDDEMGRGMTLRNRHVQRPHSEISIEVRVHRQPTIRRVYTSSRATT